MLSHLAASFPPLSLCLMWCWKQYGAQVSQGLWNLCSYPPGGAVDGEMGELNETFAGEISGLKNHTATWVTAMYASKDPHSPGFSTPTPYKDTQ